MVWTAGRNRQLGELIAEVFRTAGPVPRGHRRRSAGRGQGGRPGAARRRPVAVPGHQRRRGADAEAQRIALVAVSGGWNVTLDVTLASRPSAESWTYALRFAAYSVTAV